MAKTPDIAALLALSDAKLHEALGHNQRVSDMRRYLGEADKLQGKAREKVEAQLRRMLQPNIYPEEIRYAVEDATRKTRGGKDEIADSAPVSVMD